MPLSNKDIVNFYFKRKADSTDDYVCKCGIKRKQNAKRGHGNLMEHIRRQGL